MDSAKPSLPRLTEFAFSLKRLRLCRDLVQLVGIHQRVAVVAGECSGREFARAAPAISNQLRSD